MSKTTDQALERWAQVHRDLMLRFQAVMWKADQATEEERFSMVLDHVRQVLGHDTSVYSMTDIATMMLCSFTLGLQEQDAATKQQLCFSPHMPVQSDALMEELNQVRVPWVASDWITVGQRVLDRRGTLVRWNQTPCTTKQDEDQHPTS